MRLIFLITILFLGQCLLGQDTSWVKELAKTGRQVLVNPEFKKRKQANQEFLDLLESYVGSTKGFDDPLVEVTNMIRLAGGDDLRIYTWQMPDSAYQYQRFGLIVARTRKGIVVTRLIDATSTIAQPEFRILKADQWYGAIYYKLIPVKKKGKKKPVYTLLGYAPGEMVNRKIIDVVEVDARGRPKFGAKVFKIEEFMDKKFRKAPMRLILSYGGKYAASVRWNEEREMVIMDHLSPPDDKLKRIYHMYGPDMSYDGLVWSKGWWNLLPQVKFNSGQNIKIVPPNKPTGLPGRKKSDSNPPVPKRP